LEKYPKEIAMRPIQNAGLAAAVALVFATVAQAAVPGTVSLNRTGPLITGAPRITSPNAAATTSSGTTTTTTTTGTVTAPTNTTGVDLRNQATTDATAGTHASGSTSALGPLANGTASVNAGAGTTTATTTGAIGTMPFLGTPIYANPSDTTLGLASSTAPTTALASTDVVYGNASIAAQGIAVTEAQVNGVNVDRAINQVSRDRKRIGRNGQLLYSIAPRTNVDRSAQMPDDGPSPALTGSNSTLTR
jgi:hypothetical protein